MWTDVRRPPLLTAFKLAQRHHGDALKNPHLLQAVLLSEVVKRPSNSPGEKTEMVRYLFQEYRALLDDEVTS